MPVDGRLACPAHPGQGLPALVTWACHDVLCGCGVYAEVAGEGVVRVGDPLGVRPPEAGTGHDPDSDS